jgi:hypothetical protein
MNESDAIQALASIDDTASAYAAIYFSVTFAYLAVAYFVGDSLSRFQCMTVSVLYLLGAIIFGLSFVAYGDAWMQLKDQEVTVFDNVWLMRESIWIELLEILVVAVTLLSLYFMYNVRQTGKN